MRKRQRKKNDNNVYPRVTWNRQGTAMMVITGRSKNKIYYFSTLDRDRISYNNRQIIDTAKHPKDITWNYI